MVAVLLRHFRRPDAVLVTPQHARTDAAVKQTCWRNHRPWLCYQMLKSL